MTTSIPPPEKRPTPASQTLADQTPPPEKHPMKPPTPHWWNSKGFRITLTVAMVLIAAVVVSKAIKPEQFEKALAHMNPWWFAAALAVGTLGWVGSVIPLRVFSPAPITFKDALLLEMSSSFVGVVAPAGLGSFALSIQFLDKRGSSTAQSTATMVLIQISQFFTSVILLLIGLIVLGTEPTIKIPWATVGWVALGVVAVALLVFAIPKVRNWVVTAVRNVWKEGYPRAVWAVKHPKQLLIAMSGAVLLSASFVFALWFSLLAFGHDVSLIKLAAVFLVFNTLGSAIPVPGGVGAVEGALTVGLATMGISSAVAFSAVIAFRLATFYIPIPVGAIAYGRLQKLGLV